MNEKCGSEETIYCSHDPDECYVILQISMDHVESKLLKIELLNRLYCLIG